MNPRKRPPRKPSLDLPEKCRTCPVFLDAQADAAVNERMCHFGLITEEQILRSRLALREAGYDIHLRDEELLAELRDRTARCIGAVTLEKTVGDVRYRAVVCGSTEATIPIRQQDILFEPVTVRRIVQE